MTDDKVVAQVQAVLAQVRETLQQDGGDIELVKVEKGSVYVRFKGACSTCPFALLTFQSCVQETIKKRVDGIEKVILSNALFTSDEL